MKKLIGSKRRFLIEIFSVLIVCAFLATSLMPFIGHSGTAVNAKSVYSTPTVSTNNVIDNITVGNAPYGVAFDSINGDVYVTHRDSDNVSVINGTTNNVTGNIKVGTYSFGLEVAFDSINGDVYVSNSGSDNVSVINGATNKVTGNITVGNGPAGVAFDSINGDVYVANYISNNVSVINGTTNKVTGNIKVGTYPYGVAFDSINGDVYVTHLYDFDYVSVINGTTNKVTGNIKVGNGPDGVAFDSINGDVYVANTFSCNVSMINGTTNKVTGNIKVGTYPYGVAFDSINGDVYVVNDISNNVSVISGTNNTVIKNIQVGTDPAGVAFDSSNGDVYVANTGSNNVSVISPTYVKYTVTFKESGLSSGSTWYVNITESSNGTHYDSEAISGSSLSFQFHLANGSYTYTIATSNKTYAPYPSSGSFTVKGEPLSEPSEPITFSEVKYKVTFSESGLPSGLTWYVNLSHGQSFSSTTDTISFSEPNGTYSCTIATSDHTYKPSASSGSFTVNGAAVSESVTFSEVKYAVTFTESALPSGTSWTVTLNGKMESSTTGTITYSEINGSYSYTLIDSLYDGIFYYPDPSSGSFVVDGSSISISIAFSSSKYMVDFEESGLPTETSWTLVFDGRSYTLTNTSYVFYEPNGTYSYSATSTDYKNLSGSVPVNGESQYVNLSFVLQTYSVTFKESGLPTETSWTLVFDGRSYTLTNTSYVFYEPNGTYSYSAESHDYKNLSGTVEVSGSNQSIPLNFVLQTYPVTFSEYNLPYGTDWYINIKESNGTTYNSGPISAASFSFHLPNGTYSYTISSSDRSSVPLPSMGSFTVDGTSVSESVVFLSIFRYTVTFSESGLPNGTEWFVNLSNGRSYHSQSDTISFQEPNGIYAYSISTPDTSYSPPSSGSFTVDDSSVSVSVKFQQVDYTVTFSESGLSNGTEWFVNLSDGQSFSSTNSTISFSVPNGTYSYIITTASLHKVNALSGSISLTGRSIMKNITFPAMERSPERSGISDGSFYIIIGAVAAATIITLVTAVMIRKRK